jgi:hypothetical protein
MLKPQYHQKKKKKKAQSIIERHQQVFKPSLHLSKEAGRGNNVGVGVGVVCDNVTAKA